MPFNYDEYEFGKGKKESCCLSELGATFEKGLKRGSVPF